MLKKQIKKLFEEVESLKFELSLTKQDVTKLTQEKQVLIEKEKVVQDKYIKL